MNAEIAALLAQLPQWAFGFMLVLARAGTALMLVPGIGETEIPATIRAGLAMGLAALLLPVVQAAMPSPDAGVMPTLAAIAAEVFTGLLLGWLSRLPTIALEIAGQVIGQMVGMANVIIPGPEPGQSAISRLFAVMAPVLIFGSGLHGVILAALAGSYDLIPPGHALPRADSVDALIAAISGAISLGLRLAGPFLLLSIIWQLGLGLFARLVPRLQIYFLAMPGQVLGGMLVLALFGVAIADTWLDGARAALASLPGL